MSVNIQDFLKKFQKKNLPEIKPGDTVKIHQKIKGEVSKEGKERAQTFEGIVIARKHGKGTNATITVRKNVGGYGVEKIFPIHSPLIEKIEVISRAKVRRSKLYYLRNLSGKKAKLRQEKDFKPLVYEEEKPKEEESEKSPEQKESSKKEEAREAEKKESEEKKEEVSSEPKKEEVGEEKTKDKNEGEPEK